MSAAAVPGSIKVLLAGESWVSASTHFKGWDFFSSTVFETGIRNLQAALEGSPIQLEHLPGHLVPERFPLTREELAPYAVVILSDIG
ncbi:MAG TPA: glutamine amidotransferase, partial [Spirochaetia bacterium]|nr:glutamine amidotransferase [Spirochaetia bacterium]